MSEITLDEWIAELQRTDQGQGAEGQSTHDIAERIGRDETWVRKNILQPAARAGRLRRAQRSIMRIDGHPYKIQVYSFTA